MDEMKLVLTRVFKGPEYTIGKLTIDGVYFCDILEDAIRPVKIMHETAIPAGTYKIELVYSPHFKRILPHLINVPNYTGILMHNGTTKIDTWGCLLVGRNTEKGKVLDSRVTLNKLLLLMKDRTNITITIL